MRTTVDIDDRLLNSAKATALEEGRTLSAIVNDALREYAFGRSAAASEPWEPPLIDAGGLVPGVDIDSNAKLEDLLEDSSAAA